MFKTIFISVMFFALVFTPENEYETKVPHDIWTTLLQKHVDDNGNVAYANFVKDKVKLQEYLTILASHEPTNTWTKEEKLAYYINLYNAATVKLIVDHYPIKSIKDISSPWDKKWVKVGNETLSLGDIEHEILRKMNEPRIHFAINCASYSCPKLLNVAYLPETIEAQLQSATVNFIADTSKNLIDEKKTRLSNIFKWFKEDFTKDTTLPEFINKYTNVTLDKKTKVSYLTYDWKLNAIQ